MKKLCLTVNHNTVLHVYQHTAGAQQVWLGRPSASVSPQAGVWLRTIQDAMEEVLRAPVLRLFKQRGWWAFFHHDASIDEQHTVGDLPSESHLVRHNHHRQPVIGKL